MANAKDLRKRITSVKNTQQITKAMKMVSAAKLRRAQEAVQALRPYASGVQGLVERLGPANFASNETNRDIHTDAPLRPVFEVSAAGHTLVSDDAYGDSSELKNQKLLLIVVSSDRGLCGGFNANVIKTAQRFLRTNSNKYASIDLAFIGKKAYEFFKHRSANGQVQYHQGFLSAVNFKKSADFAGDVVTKYQQGNYDIVKVIYTEFKSAISQKVILERFLPISLGASSVDVSTDNINLVEDIIEPNAKAVMENILPRYFGIKLHRIFLESLASEHGARMSAMENASKNAGEMIHKLNLEYNKSRQAGITKELLEIISGVESQKS